MFCVKVFLTNKAFLVDGYGADIAQRYRPEDKQL